MEDFEKIKEELEKIKEELEERAENVERRLRRGYPNPDYTDDDVSPEPVEMKEEITIDETVVISPAKFEELCSKAASLDILTAHINKTGKVDDDIVFAVTGTTDIKVQNKADDYYRWWCETREERDKLREKVAQLDHARNELIEILKQNHIGPYADKADEEEEQHGQA